MGLKISECSQVRAVEDGLKSSFYKSLNKAAGKSKCMRFTGLFVGIASGLSTVVTRTALIAENVFKGVVNILGCPFSKRCSLGTGVSQILWHTPKHLVLLPFSALSGAIGLFTKTIFMLVDPEGYTNNRWCAHDPMEVENQRQAAAEARWNEQRNAYEVAADIYAQDPQDIKNLKLLGMMYRDGRGVKKDAEYACRFFSEAAALNDPQAIHIMGGFYFAGYHVQKNTGTAYACFEQAANLGFAPSMTLMGVRYLRSNDVQAFRWFERAALQNEPQALAFGAGMIAVGRGGNQANLDKAIEWFERAHHHGDKSAAHYLNEIDLFRGNYLSKWFDLKKGSEEPENISEFRLDLYRVHRHNDKPQAYYNEKIHGIHQAI